MKWIYLFISPFGKIGEKEFLVGQSVCFAYFISIYFVEFGDINLPMIWVLATLPIMFVSFLFIEIKYFRSKSFKKQPREREAVFYESDYKAPRITF